VSSQTVEVRVVTHEPERRAPLGPKRVLGIVLCEPLVHFLILGGLVFALHRALLSPLAARPSTRGNLLVVDVQKQKELAALLEQRLQRKPTAHDLDQGIQRWVEEEVLLREALRLDLWQTDPVLRDQLIARMRSLLQASVAPRQASELELDAYLAAHRERYLEPANATFIEYVVPAGSQADDVARELARRLRMAETVRELPVRHSQRPERELAALYGAQLTARIMALAPGEWQILRAPRALHVVKLESRAPARELSRDELRPRLLADLTAEHMQADFQQRLTQLTARWQVQTQLGASGSARAEVAPK
jgi:hypothetical protein